jgi:heme A synthase
MIAALAAAWLVFHAVTAAARRPLLRPRAWLLLVALGAQTTAGVVNLLLSAPVWMQLVHLLLGRSMDFARSFMRRDPGPDGVLADKTT